MKKAYYSPQVRVVFIQYCHQLLAGSAVTNSGNQINLGDYNGNGNAADAAVRGFDIDGDEW